MSGERVVKKSRREVVNLSVFSNPPYKYIFLQFSGSNINDSVNYVCCIKKEILTCGIYTLTAHIFCTNNEIVHTNASPTPGNDGTAAVVISAGNAPYTYKWSTGSTDSAITGLSPGKYFVTIADRDSCTEVDSVTIEVASGVRYKNLLPGITLFPNPATPDNAVNINISPGSLPVSIEFYDAAGRFYRRIANITHRQAVVNITGFAPGVYIYKVLNKTGAVAVGKLVVR